ncbi:unnamed protein product [Prunus armeniaca]
MRKKKDIVEIKSEVDKYLLDRAKNIENVFAVPVSTVASESAFSIGGRIIDHFRSSLTPKMVEALTCGQNWLRSFPISLDSELFAEEMEFYEQVESGMVSVPLLAAEFLIEFMATITDEYKNSLSEPRTQRAHARVSSKVPCCRLRLGRIMSKRKAPNFHCESLKLCRKNRKFN